VNGVKVRAVDGDVVALTDGRTIRANTLIWTAGTAPNPVVATLPVPKRGGRVLVNECLEVPGWPGVWALGDCALVPDGRGGFHPPTAQHALREGRAAARNIAAVLAGDAPRPFRFRSLGQLAAIGHRTGVANVFGFNFSGFLAWWLWRTVYLSKLPRFEKKVRVALDWTLDLCFAKDFASVTSGSRATAVVSEPRQAGAA
jgi:NADH dehydrogenase